MVLEDKGIYKFLGIIYIVSSLVTLMRNVHKSIRASPIPHIYFFGVTCTTICLQRCYNYNGLCTSNMFMVSQVVVLWSYKSYTFCVVIYLSTNIYLTKYRRMVWDNRHYMQIWLRKSGLTCARYFRYFEFLASIS